jgi:hypothetical protein
VDTSLSEVSTDFDATDIVVIGGILTDFALKANETKIYIATFTPTLNSVTAGTISVAVVFSISASKATPTAISDRVNSALLVDCMSAAGSKSTAFGTLVSIIKNTALKAKETKIYIATFTPTLNSVTAGTISVASDKFSDVAGNTNVDGADANNSVFSCCINFTFIGLKCKISQYTPCNNYISGVKISGYFA